MRSSAAKQALLYVADGYTNVYAFTFPQLQPVGALSVSQGAEGLCVDHAGDVFVVTLSPSGITTIFEFAHGGTTAIQTLNEPGAGVGCAVDPQSGDLAIGNVWDHSNPYNSYGSSVAVYAKAQGSPSMYYNSNPEFGGFSLCGYDDSGNLYISGFDNYEDKGLLVRLPHHTDSFEAITLKSKATIAYPFSVQWDGTHLTESSMANHQRAPAYVYRLKLSGMTAKVIGATRLSIYHQRHEGQIWIDNDRVVGVDGASYGGVSVWPYPKSGKPLHTIRHIADSLWGVTVSHAGSSASARVLPK